MNGTTTKDKCMTREFVLVHRSMWFAIRHDALLHIHIRIAATLQEKRDKSHQVFPVSQNVVD